MKNRDCRAKISHKSDIASAKASMDEKNWEEAAIKWCKLRTLIPQNPVPYVQGTIALMNLGNLEAAEHLVTETCELFPTHPPCFIWLGHVLTIKNDLEGAARQWAEVRRRFEGVVSGYIQGVAVLLQLGRDVQGKALINESRRLFPDNQQVLIQSAQYYMSCRDWLAANREWAILREKAPNNPLPCIQGIITLMFLGDNEKARDLSRTTSAMWPKHESLLCSILSGTKYSIFTDTKDVTIDAIEFHRSQLSIYQGCRDPLIFQKPDGSTMVCAQEIQNEFPQNTKMVIGLVTSLDGCDRSGMYILLAQKLRKNGFHSVFFLHESKKDAIENIIKNGHTCYTYNNKTGFPLLTGFAAFLYPDWLHSFDFPPESMTVMDRHRMEDAPLDKYLNAWPGLACDALLVHNPVPDFSQQMKQMARLRQDHFDRGVTRGRRNLTIIPSGYLRNDYLLNRYQIAGEDLKDTIVLCMAHLKLEQVWSKNIAWEITCALLDNFPNMHVAVRPSPVRNEWRHDYYAKFRTLSVSLKERFSFNVEDDNINLFKRAAVMVAHPHGTVAESFSAFSGYPSIIGDFENKYFCQPGKTHTGFIVKDINGMIEAVRDLLNSPDEFRSTIQEMRTHKYYKLGRAVDYLADNMIHLVTKKDHPSKWFSYLNE